MADWDKRAEYLERAKMHERLAESTKDSAARQMHQAMATEFRRRADQSEAEDMPPPPSAPRLELHAIMS